jgi:hypothetical protein
MEHRIKECQLDLFADRTPVQARGRLVWGVGCQA